jgi:tape measure domain-containing protein
MTRLSAAVKGAGGTVSDSAFAFRAVSEAVKATGGNAEQADGALLALTQVFSKGKVSAEELNQIAERLPGTFTLFAKAAGKSGPELQKALQEGQVGLNDLMKFLQLISTEYGQTALKIAKSSQEAGARLSVAMQDMQLAVGRALQPVGTLLQDAFAAFIRRTTPALVLSAKLIGGGITNMYNAFASGINILVSLRGVFENLAKTMLVFGGITAGVFVASNITTFTNALKGALAVLRTLLSVEKALLVIENARIAAQAILAGLTTGATKGKILGAILGGAAGVGAVIGIGKLVEGVIGDIEKGLSGALKGVDLKLPTLSKFPTPSAGSDKTAKDAEKEREKAAEEALRQQTSLNRLLQEQLRLNYEAGAVDADALSKLDAEATLLKLITRLKIDEVTLSAKTRQEREQGIINLTAEFNAENKRIKKQRREILEEIAGLGDDIKKEWRELTGVFIDESLLTLA